MAMRRGTMIFGTAYVADQNRAWLVDKWIRLMSWINPSCRLEIIDSASPIPIDDLDLCYIHQIGDNIGHLGSTGRDGWGRAFSIGLQRAIEGNYEYVALIDTDILFTVEVDTLVDQMRKENIKYGTVRGDPYAWMEGGIVFAEVEWLQDIDFIGRYDWEGVRLGIFPEFRLMNIAGTNLHDFNIYGRRNDDGLITPDSAMGVRWITHAPKEVYEEFIRVNGMGELLK